jgi:hypothetical protein
MTSSMLIEKVFQVSYEFLKQRIGIPDEEE